MKDQIIHLIDTESMLAGRSTPEVIPPSSDYVHNDIGRFNETWVLALRHLEAPAVLRLFAEVADLRLAALRTLTPEEWEAPSWTPVGDATYRRFMQIRIFDSWVHLRAPRSH